METSLHRQLKALYGESEESVEVVLGDYRIDAVVDGRLIEIQYSSLAAIRDKIRTLCQSHVVVVVKPLAARKVLIKKAGRGGRDVTTRTSPLRETVYHLFAELVHFVNVFPHPNLTLDVLLTEQEEHRRMIKARRWRKDYKVEDRLLLGIVGRYSLRTASDLANLLPPNLTEPFSTLELAKAAGIPRWLAQKTCYCLRKTGAMIQVGKKGNAWIYQVPKDRAAS
ncbi:MAG: hypothetical protein U1D30_14830 [Planctomycetota bacterium]